MRRVVVDTNCLLASLNRNSPFHRLYELFASEVFEWVLSNEILTEYEEILAAHYSTIVAQRVTEILLNAPNTSFQEACFKWQLIEADPDDNKFVDVALAAGADYLVTNDRHFEILKQLEFPRMAVVSLQDFLSFFQ
ncbi:putative toxin-antitoxin system toxin component, PIN family [Hymenobacter actinosclerus]|uniref:Putative toxin-antitoxin system toxin component, PIN family n=1 Tax=Hymenobacter actinosclerus TaxID=82805 RepID=A0A1I0HCK9_9BACT|nr:putative toxin-antitoxin system toxin component, PIN family [Hymenobacter actinosclerus]SET81547.1 putative toxin-antitoxin system toxin component, PIN family [Hymenobacter actinosclerus]